MKPQQKASIQEKRAFLRELSAQATEMREKMLHNCKNDAEIQQVNSLKINEILVDHFYKDAQNTEFKSFKGWLKDGKVVRKGETAFLLWGKPTDRKADGTEQPIMEDEDGNTFFPVSFIFSNAQVHEQEKKASA